MAYIFTAVFAVCLVVYVKIPCGVAIIVSCVVLAIIRKMFFNKVFTNYCYNAYYRLPECIWGKSLTRNQTTAQCGLILFALFFSLPVFLVEISSGVIVNMVLALRT